MSKLPSTVMSLDQANEIFTSLSVPEMVVLAEHINETIEIPDWCDYDNQLANHITHLIQCGLSQGIIKQKLFKREETQGR